MNTETLYKMRYDDLLINLVNENITGGDKIGIEIGSYAGESTLRFLKTGKFKTLYCIDPWTNGYDSADEASYTNHLAEIEFDNNIIKKFENVIKIKDYSYNIFNQFNDKSIDFIYIDGCHTYESVLTDLKNYFPKVKDDGIISGHDYPWTSVKNATDEFFKSTPHKTYIDGSWIYFKNKLNIN